MLKHNDSDVLLSETDERGMSGAPVLIAEVLKKGVTYTQDKKEAIEGTISQQKQSFGFGMSKTQYDGLRRT